jgi:RimJ/RimL family protein N-acetyltransferase
VIRVRPAEPGDAGELVALAESVGREEGRWMLVTDTWRPVADERKYLRAVRHHPDAAVLVAEDEGRLIGRLSIARDPHPASRHVADVGLMVAADRRREGVGRTLLAAAIDWARGAGIGKLELHVFPWNEAAIRLYESVGFEREGYRKAHFRRDDEYVDAILMAFTIPG